jgi:hypothetical protein
LTQKQQKKTCIFQSSPDIFGGKPEGSHTPNALAEKKTAV